MNKSILYQISAADFIEIVKTSKNYTELLSKCKMVQRGANRKTVIRRMKMLGVNYDHLKSNLGKTFEHRRYTLEEANAEIFICPSSAKTGTVKTLILRHKLIPYKCECGIENEWRGKQISLQLEHRNGNHNDNRLENLTFLCPNCHSQTNTFAGKSSYKNRNAADFKQYNTEEFKKDCTTLSAKDLKNKYKISQYVLRRVCELVGISPPKQKRGAEKVKWTNSVLLELTNDVKHTSLRKLGKKYGVSANRLKEVCQEHNIVVPKIKI